MVVLHVNHTSAKCKDYTSRKRDRLIVQRVDQPKILQQIACIVFWETGGKKVEENRIHVGVVTKSFVFVIQNPEEVAQEQ